MDDSSLKAQKQAQKDNLKEAQKDAQALAQYLSRKRILIADSNTTARVGIAKGLVELGAKMAQITLVDSFVWAQETLQTMRPEIIVTDYQLSGRSGLELFEIASRFDIENAERLHMIVTSNTSQAAVAQAAEGDVDVYVTKPYSMDLLRRALTEAIREKLMPSAYLRTLQDGKALVQSGSIDRALKVFERAKSLHDRPALACYYIGYSHQLTKALDLAAQSYQTGLEYNRVHLKCLLGLFDALEKQDKHIEAYAIFKNIVARFPVSPTRLASALRLAVVTRSFADIDEYYALYTEIDSRDETLIRHMCAALIVAGKNRLAQNDSTAAVEYFRKAAVTAAGRMNFLTEIITTLAEAGLPDQADLFLKRVPNDQRETPDYRALDYLVLSKTSTLPARLDHGRKLVRSGQFHPLIYRLLIEATIEAGLKDTADNLLIDARRLWPDFQVNKARSAAADIQSDR